MNPVLDEKVKNEIEILSKKMFKVFDLSGVVRIDFMVKDDKVFVNEINTIPGSLAFYLWKDKNLEFFELIDELIMLAKQKTQDLNMNYYSFTSNVLANYCANNVNKYSK